MPRPPDPDASLISLHGGLWRISIGVPAELRDLLGGRLIKSLGTASRTEADKLKVPHVAAMRQLVTDAWLAHASGGPRYHLAREAMGAARLRGHPTLPKERFDAYLADRAEEIRADPEYGATREEREESVRKFRIVACGERTPIALHLPTYAEGLPALASELAEAASHRLSFWLIRNGREPFLDAVDPDLVERFAEAYGTFFKGGPTARKALSSLNAYWSHLVDEGIVPDNPFSPSGAGPSPRGT